jgi:hypothetical protein
MKAVPSGAGRYIWCQSQLVWLNMAMAARLEDLEGAFSANQSGLTRYSAIALGEDCAVILALALTNEKPLPTRSMRPSWALERIRDHPLHDECWSLIRSFPADRSNGEIREDCLKLVRAVREIVGEVPDGLTNEGLFPGVALARDWNKMVDELHQESFFPKEWIRSAAPKSAAT